MSRLAAGAAVFGYLMALTIVYWMTIRQHARSGQRRSSSQVSVVMLLRYCGLSALVITVIAARVRQPLPTALGLAASIVTTALGEVIWRARWRGSPPQRSL